jgi:vesicle transport protein SEC22
VHADTFIQKTKKLYMDTRTQRNLSKMTEDLSEVQSIMTRNIQEVLGQGEKLDRKCASRLARPWSSSAPPGVAHADMTKLSSTLASESKQYAVRAKDLHRQVRASGAPHEVLLRPTHQALAARRPRFGSGFRS